MGSGTQWNRLEMYKELMNDTGQLSMLEFAKYSFWMSAALSILVPFDLSSKNGKYDSKNSTCFELNATFIVRIPERINLKF